MLAHGRLWTAYLIVFVSSACTLVLELVAGRLLAPYVGVSLYTWTSIIGVVLAGITVGNYLGGVLADRRPERTTLGALLLASGAASLAVLLLVGLLAPVAGAGWPLVLRILLLAAVFFLPSAILGMVSPVVVRLSLDDLGRAGHTVGKIYACSALGSIVGTFLTGYWLIAWFGTRGIIVGVGLVLAAMAVAFGGFARPAKRPLAVAAVAAGAALALQVSGLLRGPCNVAESSYYCIQVRDGEYQGHAVRQLILDHLIHSHSDLADPGYIAYEYERAYATVTAAIAARQPAVRALFIGGGGYTFPRYLEQRYPAASIEVAEIDPAVTAAAYAYMGLPADSRVVTDNRDARLVLDDLIAQGRQFDVVFGDAFNDLSIPYHLTTREFAAKLARLVAPGGAYLANIIDDPVRGEFMRAYAQTLNTAFPHIAVVSTAASRDLGGLSTYVLAASATPLDPAEVPLMPPERVAAWLAAGRPLVLSDDYAPVDNLMAPMFAERGS
ncbi:MAG TPA: fused MFS/spermidine synthase [Chloroflexota bacterium]